MPPAARSASPYQTTLRGGLFVLCVLLHTACPAGRTGPGTRAPAEVGTPRPPAVDAGTPATDAALDATAAMADASATGRSRGYPIFGLRRDACVAQGGVYYDERALSNRCRGPDPAAPSPTPRCWMPSTLNGSACRDAADCGSGRCFCTGELDGPDVLRRHPEFEARDGTPAVGRCSDLIIEPGAWFCLVEGGRARLRGIIVD